MIKQSLIPIYLPNYLLCVHIVMQADVNGAFYKAM